MGELILWIVVILLLALAIGAPVSFATGFTAVAVMAIFVSTRYLPSFANVAYGQASNPNQLVIPLFILMAELLSRGKIAEDIYYVLNKYMKKIKGGLALSTTLACTVFAALVGSSPATAAAVGRISVEQMTKRGYKESFAIGTVAGGGTLGIMIPPSLVFVQFGILTETSIVKLLMAGLLPGIMLSALMCISIVIRVKLDPSLIGETKTGEKLPLKNAEGEVLQKHDDIDNKQTTLLQDCLMSVPSVFLILLVLGCMYLGIATPTEAAGFGVIGAFCILIGMRRIGKEVMKVSFKATTKTSAMMLVLMIAGLCLTQVISRLGIATALAEGIIQSGLNRWVIMILLYILWYILGCMMSPGSMIVLTIPFIFPTLVALGFHPLWIGVVATLCVEVGMITPPVGLNLFVLKASTSVPMKSILVGALPYVLVLTIGLAILNLFPQLALIIPSTM